jgi:hypothetical protein
LAEASAVAKPFEKSRCGVILRMLFLGIFVGGIPMAGLAAWGTWQSQLHPQIESKDDSDENTILGQACVGFGLGAVLGGFAGLIGSAILDACRNLREEFSDFQR